jgi:hypothetical protein
MRNGETFLAALDAHLDVVSRLGYIKPPGGNPTMMRTGRAG